MKHIKNTRPRTGDKFRFSEKLFRKEIGKDRLFILDSDSERFKKDRHRLLCIGSIKKVKPSTAEIWLDVKFKCKIDYTNYRVTNVYNGIFDKKATHWDVLWSKENMYECTDKDVKNFITAYENENYEFFEKVIKKLHWINE